MHVNEVLTPVPYTQSMHACTWHTCLHPNIPLALHSCNPFIFYMHAPYMHVTVILMFMYGKTLRETWMHVKIVTYIYASNMHVRELMYVGD